MKASSNLKLTDLTMSISKCDSFDNSIEFILSPLIKQLKSSYAVIVIFGILGREVSSVERMALVGPARAAEMYQQEHFRSDPIRSHPSNVPARLSDFLGNRAIAADDNFQLYVNSCLRANGIGPCMALRFPINCAAGLKEAEIAFLRQSDREDYDNDDLHFLQSLEPIIRLTISNIILKEDNSLLNKMITSISSHFNTTISLRSDHNSRIYQPLLPNGSHKYSNIDNDCSCQILAGHPLSSLTDREWQIINALENGHSNASMSSALGISIRTVENHLRSIYMKTNVNSRTQLISHIRSANIRPLEIDLRDYRETVTRADRELC